MFLELKRKFIECHKKGFSPFATFKLGKKFEINQMLIDLRKYPQSQTDLNQDALAAQEHLIWLISVKEKNQT